MIAASSACVVLTSGCGPIVAQAPPAQANVVVTGARRATFVVLGLPLDRDLCSPFGIRSVCVQGLTDEMRRGVRTVLDATMLPASDPSSPDYVAELVVDALDMDRNNWTNRVLPRFRWHFKVRGRDGRTVIEIRETTIAPAPIPFDGDGQVALALVENLALERIRRVVVEADLQP